MATETATRQVIVQADGSLTVPAEVLDRAGIKPGDNVVIWQSNVGDLRIHRVEYLTPAQLAVRYPITAPIDMKTIREEWEEEAAAEVIAEMRRDASRPS